MKNNKGISLIALIVTIIVIIILAAIVIGGVFNTPNSAKFATFCQEYDRVQTAIQMKYYDLYQKYAILASTEVPTHYEIYNELATGIAADSLTGTSNIDSDSWVTIEDSQWGNSKYNICSKPKVNGNWYLRLNDGKLAYSGFEKDEKEMYYTPTAYTTDNRIIRKVDYFNGLLKSTAEDSETQVGLTDLLTAGAREDLPSLGANEAYLVNVVKPGDYVTYTPSGSGYTPNPEETGNESTAPIGPATTKWRVWDIKNGSVRLISDRCVSSLALGTAVKTENSSLSEQDGDTKAMYGARAYTNAIKVLNDACASIYGSNIAKKVENISYNDIAEKAVSMPGLTELHFAYYLDNTGYTKGGSVQVTKSDGTKVVYTKQKCYESMYNGIEAPRFYAYDTDGITYDEASQKVETSGVTYMKPTVVNGVAHPVYVTQTLTNGNIAWGENTITDSHVEGTNNYGDILGDYPSWVTNKNTNLSTHKAGYFVSYLYYKGLYAYGLAYSDGESASTSLGLRPIVTLNNNAVVNISDTDKNGSSETNAWQLK